MRRFLVISILLAGCCCPAGENSNHHRVKHHQSGETWIAVGKPKRTSSGHVEFKDKSGVTIELWEGDSVTFEPVE